MGNFRIVINAVGGHGQDRDKVEGEKVFFGENGETPDQIAFTAVKNLLATGNNVMDARIIHWPDSPSRVEDNLLTELREKGNFKNSGPAKGLNFGDAIEALKSGRKVSRLGWNGKGMFLWLNRGVHDFHSKDGETVQIYTEIDGVSSTLFEGGDRGVTTRMPNINMHTATGTTVTGWLASQTDILSDDWCIIE